MFGIIKAPVVFRQFLLSWLEKVRIDWDLWPTTWTGYTTGRQQKADRMMQQLLIFLNFCTRLLFSKGKSVFGFVVVGITRAYVPQTPV